MLKRSRFFFKNGHERTYGGEVSGRTPCQKGNVFKPRHHFENRILFLGPDQSVKITVHQAFLGKSTEKLS